MLAQSRTTLRMFACGGTLLASAIIGTAPPAIASTLHVPADYPTIQAAVDAANACGDSVIVAAGTYLEDVAVAGKSLALLGQGATTTSLSSLAWDGSVESCASLVADVTVAGTFEASGLLGPFDMVRCSNEGAVFLSGRILIRVNACCPSRKFKSLRSEMNRAGGDRQGERCQPVREAATEVGGCRRVAAGLTERRSGVARRCGRCI